MRLQTGDDLGSAAQPACLIVDGSSYHHIPIMIRFNWSALPSLFLIMLLGGGLAVVPKVRQSLLAGVNGGIVTVDESVKLPISKVPAGPGSKLDADTLQRFSPQHLLRPSLPRNALSMAGQRVQLGVLAGPELSSPAPVLHGGAEASRWRLRDRTFAFDEREIIGDRRQLPDSRNARNPALPELVKVLGDLHPCHVAGWRRR